MKVPTEVKTILERDLDGIDQTKPLLTLRDREIELLCHLKTNPTEDDIGHSMSIERKSVENYKKRIADKLGLKGRRCVVNCVLKNFKIFEDLSTYFIKSDKITSEKPN